MALIECYECGKQISSTATACPHCGAPAKHIQAPKKPRIGRTRKLAIVAFWIVVAFSAYSVVGRFTTEKLGLDVMASMQETFDTDADYSKYGLRFTDMTVVKVQGNQYQGLATVTYEGEEHPLSVDITYDGETFMWRVQGDGFGFLAPALFKDSFQDAYKEVTEQFNEAMRSFENELSTRNADPDISTVEWSVQVASLSEKEHAEKLVRDLRAKGYNAYAKATPDMYRIYIGPYKNRVDAESVKSRLQTEHKLDGFVLRQQPN